MASTAFARYAPTPHAPSMRRRILSATAAIASISRLISSTLRTEYRSCLYTGQKAHLFQWQLRVILRRMLWASLGGRMRPVSNAIIGSLPFGTPSSDQFPQPVAMFRHRERGPP